MAVFLFLLFIFSISFTYSLSHTWAGGNNHGFDCSQIAHRCSNWEQKYCDPYSRKYNEIKCHQGRVCCNGGHSAPPPPQGTAIKIVKKKGGGRDGQCPHFQRECYSGCSYAVSIHGGSKFCTDISIHDENDELCQFDKRCRSNAECPADYRCVVVEPNCRVDCSDSSVSDKSDSSGSGGSKSSFPGGKSSSPDGKSSSPSGKSSFPSGKSSSKTATSSSGRGSSGSSGRVSSGGGTSSSGRGSSSSGGDEPSGRCILECNALKR